MLCGRWRLWLFTVAPVVLTAFGWLALPLAEAAFDALGERLAVSLGVADPWSVMAYSPVRLPASSAGEFAFNMLVATAVVALLWSAPLLPGLTGLQKSRSVWNPHAFQVFSGSEVTLSGRGRTASFRVFRDSAGQWQVEPLASAASWPATGRETLEADAYGVSGRVTLPDPPDVHLTIGGWQLVFSAGGDEFVWFYRTDPELDVQVAPSADRADFQPGP